MPALEEWLTVRARYTHDIWKINWKSGPSACFANGEHDKLFESIKKGRGPGSAPLVQRRRKLGQDSTARALNKGALAGNTISPYLRKRKFYDCFYFLV